MSSSTGGAQHWGDWRPANDACHHDKKWWRATDVSFESCYMADPLSTAVGTVLMWTPIFSFLPVNLVNLKPFFMGTPYLAWTGGKKMPFFFFCQLNSWGFRNVSDGKGVMTHDYVEIRFECECCDSTTRYTYDLSNDGKRSRAGQYMKMSHKKRGFTGGRLYFTDCEQIYSQMWGRWSAVKTCGTWATDFYDECRARA